MTIEDMIDTKAEAAQTQLKDCDCSGKSSAPWNYCVDCQAARSFLDSLMSSGEEDYDENG